MGIYFRPSAPFTGGTVSGDTIFLGSLSAGTIFSGTTNLYEIFSTTGDTSYLQNEINQLSGSTSAFTQVSTFNSYTALTQNQLNTKANLSGATFTGQVNATSLSATTLSGGTIFSGTTDLYNVFSTSDYFTTGSTFDSNTKIATFSRNDGDNYTLDLSTLSTVDTFTTGFTYDNFNTFTIKQNEGKPDLNASINNLSINSFSASTIFSGNTDLYNIFLTNDVFVTGGTYSNGTAIFTNNTGGTFNVDGFLYGDFLPLSGGTVSGLTNFNSSLYTNSFTGDSIFTNSIVFNTGATETSEVGKLNWNDEDGTLELGLKGGNVTLQIGQEEVVRVVNKTGSNLLGSEYKVCRIRTKAEGGTQGQRLAVVLAQANSKLNHRGILGLVTENINTNQEGFITTFGKVTKINTTGSLQGETWSDGDELWLSDNNPGVLTNVEPLTHPVSIGYVVYAHQNNGKIFVSVQNGVDELIELHDVDINNPQQNDLLIYSGGGIWTNSNILNSKADLSGATFTGQVNVPSLSATTLSGGTIFSGSTPLTTVINNIASQYSGVTGDFLSLSGGTVTGNTSFTAGFTGNTGLFSGSAQNVLTVIGSGSTQPLFTIQGSSGELFSVTDSLVGSLFSVNDISGLPVFETFSDSTVLMGNYLAPSLNTTVRITANSGITNIYSIPTSLYTGAFFEYTLISTGSTGARSGNIMSIWSGSTAQFTETSTLDIGTTTGVTFSVGISGGNAVLSSSATTAGWIVKTIIRSI